MMTSENLIIDLLNEFIEVNIVGINRIMPEYIKQLGLDPMKDAGSGKDSRKINDVCTATVRYNFSCLKGLHSLSISRFEIMSIEKVDNIPNDPKNLEGPFIVGKVQIDAELDSEIQCNVKGNVEDITCNKRSIPLSSGLTYSAIVHAKTVKLENACISLFGRINDKKLTLECIKITKFPISYSEPFIDNFTLEWENKKIHIEIPYQQEVSNAILALLKEKIDPVIIPKIQSTVEEHVNENLPLYVGLDDLRKIIPIKKKIASEEPMTDCEQSLQSDS